MGWAKPPPRCPGGCCNPECEDCAPDTEPPDTDQDAPSRPPTYEALWEVREALRAFLYDPDGKSTPGHLAKLRRLVPPRDPAHWVPGSG